MTDDVSHIFDQFEPNEPANTEIIRQAEVELAYPLPPEYVEFLGRSNGGAGHIGHRYLHLWRVEELPEMNVAYAVAEFTPGLILFGSDGGDTGYAFDATAAMRIVAVPFIGMSRVDARVLCDKFGDFLAEESRG